MLFLPLIPVVKPPPLQGAVQREWSEDQPPPTPQPPPYTLTFSLVDIQSFVNV